MSPSDDTLPPAADAPVPVVTFLGIPFHCVDVHAAAARIAARPPGLPFAYVVTPNAAQITRFNELKDERFRSVYERAWLRTMDGRVPRALARQVFGLDIPLATGSDTTAELFRNFIQPDDAITIIGGSEEMLRLLKEQYHLTNVHMHVPPMGFINRPDEVEACVAFVLAHPARYVFLVTGSPRSEYLAQLIDRRGGAVGVGLCVGNSLNFLTGIATRAPLAFRKRGLEWLHRLIYEPKVYVRRIFVDSMPIFLTVVKARLNPAAYGMARGASPGGAP